MVEDLAAVLRMWQENDAATSVGVAVPSGAAATRAVRYMVPTGYKSEIVDVAEMQGLPPVRKRGEFAFTDQSSFVAFVNDQKTSASAIFVGEKDFEAFLNGHEPEGDISSAGYYDFTAGFSPKTTRPWRAWLAVADRALPQAAFAELIEERMGEILEPPGAQLYEIATALKVHTSVLFDSKVKISNGQVQLTYREEIEQGGGQAGDLLIPERLTLLLSPYEGVPPEEISVRLRMAVSAGKASWVIVLSEEAEKLREKHFEVMVTAVRELCDVPVYRGSCSF